MWVGVWTAAGSAFVMALPLIWGRSQVNRFFVAFGFIGLLMGMSFILHGALDWLGGRGGRR